MAVQETSRAAFEQLRPELPKRQAVVLKALFAYHDTHGIWPTGYELFFAMRQAGTAVDLNSTRPRLTELSKAKHIKEGPKRICRITKHRALTWVGMARQARARRGRDWLGKVWFAKFGRDEVR